MAILKIKDVMEICDAQHQTVLGWIKKGYLKATPLNPGKYRSAYQINEEDLKEFMESDEYKGHPEDIRGGRPFERTPIIENCYPVNLLIAVRQIDLESEELTPDIWDYDIRQFRKLISQLTDTEQRVIEMRYHFGMTLDEIAAAYDRSRERIRQIQRKAERKLRHWLISRGCKVIMRETYQELLDKYRQLNANYEKIRAQLELLTGPSAFESAGEPKVEAQMITVEDMNLSVRSYNCLKRAGINTLKDIIDFDMDQENIPSNHNWLTIRNLGKKSLMEVAKKVFEYCRYRIQYFHDSKYQGYIPILEGESLVIGNVEYYGGEV